MASKNVPTISEQKRELEYLAGLVERVTFHNTENGFCVLRLKVKGERDLITLVGHAPSVTPGEYASASGAWVADREHGRQFKAVFIKISPPNTLTGIERYLGRCRRSAKNDESELQPYSHQQLLLNFKVIFSR